MILTYALLQYVMKMGMTCPLAVPNQKFTLNVKDRLMIGLLASGHPVIDFYGPICTFRHSRSYTHSTLKLFTPHPFY